MLYDLLFTTDQNLRHQQNTTRLPLRVLVLEAPDTTAPAIERLGPAIRFAVDGPPDWRLGVLDGSGRLLRLEPA